MKRVFSQPTRTSQCSAMSMPEPTAAPLIIAMVGLRISEMSRCNCVKPWKTRWRARAGQLSVSPRPEGDLARLAVTLAWGASIVAAGKADMLQAVVRESGGRRRRLMRMGRRDQHGLAAEPHDDALLPGIERARRVDVAAQRGAEH